MADISNFIDNYLLANFDDIPEEQREEILKDINDPTPLANDLVEEEEEGSKNLATMIGDMKLGKKIKLAMLGNMSARAILIKQNSRQVREAVIQNPRLTDAEVLEFARNSNLDKHVFKLIAKNSTWMKSYNIKCALVSNPKTPIGISIRWIKFLKDKELRNLSKSKSIPSALASQVRKLVEIRSQK